MTVLEVIQRSTEFLAKKEVDSPRLQAELLLAHVLKLPRMGLYLAFERKLTELETETLRGLVQRRSKREPLQHILGTTSFCGLELAVDRRVLVPRQETEILAEMAWEFVSGFATTEPTVLDFGTGSGCLAITIAAKCARARVVALDLSSDALEVARGNAQRHSVDGRIDFRNGDGFAAVPEEKAFDLIVSNPPYIPSGEIPTLQPEVREHDPVMALDGGAAGVDFYLRLASESQRKLKPGGKIMMEFGDGQGESIAKMFRDQMWIVESVREDYSGRQRILTARPNG